MDSSICGNVERISGQWRIELFLPEWVVDDILRDSSSSVLSVIRLRSSSSRDSYYGEDKETKVLGAIRFEEST